MADTLTDHEGWVGSAPDENLVVSSFGWKALRTFHERLPDVPVAAITSEVPGRSELADLARWADACAVDFRELDADAAARVRDAELGLIAWTVDEPEHLREVFTWDVTAVASNRPKVALQLLRERSS